MKLGFMYTAHIFEGESFREKFVVYFRGKTKKGCCKKVMVAELSRKISGDCSIEII
jgi:hypothetical protein